MKAAILSNRFDTVNEREKTQRQNQDFMLDQQENDSRVDVVPKYRQREQGEETLGGKQGVWCLLDLPADHDESSKRRYPADRQR